MTDTAAKTPVKRRLICSNCGDIGHDHCDRQYTEEERANIDKLIQRRVDARTAAREKDRLKKIEARKSPLKRAQEKEYRDSEDAQNKRKERQAQYAIERKTATELNIDRKTAKELLAERAHNIVIDQQRPDALAPEEELARIDAEYDFGKYKRSDKDIYMEAAPKLSYAYLTNNCCAVCACDGPKAHSAFHPVEDDLYIRKLRLRVALTAARKLRMPRSVQADYNLRNYDKRLDGLILCREGLYSSTGSPIDLEQFEPIDGLTLCVCDACDAVIMSSSQRPSGRKAPAVVVSTAASLPEAGSKRSRRQQERRECTLSDAEGGSSSSSDEENGEEDALPEVVDRLRIESSDDAVPPAPSSSETEPIMMGSESANVSHRDAEPKPHSASSTVAPEEELKPPINAIANGNWIGYLPRKFTTISRTEEQTVSLMIVCIYVSTVVGSGNKVLNSHHYIIKNPNPIIRSIAHDVTGSIRFTLVGANVTEALAMLRKRYPMRVDLAREFAEFLDSENFIYQAHDHNLGDDLEEVLQPENFIVDRSDESAEKVSAKLRLVRLMQFGITSEKSGDAELDADPQPEAEAEAEAETVPGLVADEDEDTPSVDSEDAGALNGIEVGSTSAEALQRDAST